MPDASKKLDRGMASLPARAKAPKARECNSLGQRPRTRVRKLILALKARNEGLRVSNLKNVRARLRPISRLQRSTLFMAPLPGPLAQAITFRAVGAERGGFRSRLRFPSRNQLKTPLSFSLPAIFLVQDLFRPVSVEPLPRVWIIAQVSIPERRRHGQDRAVMIWIAWLAVTR